MFRSPEQLFEDARHANERMPGYNVKVDCSVREMESLLGFLGEDDTKLVRVNVPHEDVRYPFLHEAKHRGYAFVALSREPVPEFRQYAQREE